jgi:GT2 family glycosyltransferase
VDGSVVVLSWNGRELLERCLPPLVDSLQRCAGRWDLIVVDNGSTDGSVELLRSTWPAVRVIENPTNLGFSAAANQGIFTASGELVAFVNNDVVVTPSWLAELEGALAADPTLGSVAAQMRYLDQPRIINSAGIRVDLTGRAFDRRDGGAVEDEPARPEQVFGASAGAAVYRRSLLLELGGFDERFFAYLEDVDLAWRARRLGWGCAYIPTAVVLHEHSATSARIGGLKTYLSTRNHWWLVAKNASPNHLVIAAPLLLLLGLWTALTSLVEKRDSAGLRGLRDAARSLPTLVREPSPGRSLPVRSFDRPSFFDYRRRDRVMRRLRSGAC